MELMNKILQHDEKNRHATTLYVITPEDLRDFAIQLVNEVHSKFACLNPANREGNHGNQNQLLTRKEVAQILNISLSSVINYENRGLLPAVKCGGIVRYQRADVDQLSDKFKVHKV